MKQVKIMLDQASSLIKHADHLAYVTYKIVNEPKLLKNIFEKIWQATQILVKALLRYEQLYKRVDNVSYSSFKRIANKYEINDVELGVIEKILQLNDAMKNSTIEFSRQNKLVIMNGGFRSTSLSIDNIKEFLLVLKMVNKKITKKLSQDILLKRYG